MFVSDSKLNPSLSTCLPSVTFEARLFRCISTDTTALAFDIILVMKCPHFAFKDVILHFLTVNFIQMGVLSCGTVTALTRKQKKKIQFEAFCIIYC